MGLYGRELEKAITEAEDSTEELVHGIIASGSVTQFFAGDGEGKSTLLIQAELEASLGIEVFSEHEVARPLRILHIQTERPPREAYNRLKLMVQRMRVPVNMDNFYFEAGLQGLDISHREDRETIIRHLLEVKTEFGEIDWVHIDPIYAWTSGDLSTATGCGEVNDMIRRIQTNVCTTISYNHHPNRGVRDKTTGKRMGEDMYGNRFLSANCTGIFHIKGRANGGGSTWTRKKDSWGCLAKKIDLVYDPHFYMSYVDGSNAFSSKLDRINSFLKVCKMKGKSFTFDQFCRENNVSTTYGRVQMSVQVKSGRVKVTNPHDKRYLYAVE